MSADSLDAATTALLFRPIYLVWSFFSLIANRLSEHWSLCTVGVG